MPPAVSPTAKPPSGAPERPIRSSHSTGPRRAIRSGGRSTARSSPEAGASGQTAPPFRWPIRIYWEDTDAAGIVFYANHLKFFERARTEWLRGLGFGQEALRRERNVAFVVAESNVRYLAPARLDDLIEVSVELKRAGAASLEVAQQARRDGALLAEGTIRIGCVSFTGPGTFRPCRIPDSIVAALAATSPETAPTR